MFTPGNAAGALALAAAFGLAAAPAKADLLASSFNVAPQATGAAVIALDLNGPGAGINLPFVLPAPDAVAISFDAECAVGGAGFAAQANINILVDPAPPGPGNGGFAPLPPSAGPDDAFCAANGTFGVDGEVNASRTVVTPVLPPGVNTVAVQLVTVFGAGPSVIDDLSVVVEN
jgi:hypothetical protein